MKTSNCPHVRSPLIRLSYVNPRGWVRLWVFFCLIVTQLGPTQANACDAPNVLIALDRSGSMSLSIAQHLGAGPRIPGVFMTRAEVAERAIRRIVERYSNRARFGLAMFPQLGADCAPGERPLVGRLERGTLSLELNTAEQFVQQMSANNQPGGDTPIAAALERYTQWMAGQAGERHLIIVTDGVESCMRFGRLLERAQEARRMGIKVHVIGFAVSILDSIQLNRFAQAAGSNEALFANDQRSLDRLLSDTIAPIIREVCDGRDNDCDGHVDEGFEIGRRCQTGGVGQCRHGTIACGGPEGVICQQARTPVAEDCDGHDNDCDGVIDEGVLSRGYCETGLSGQCGGGQAVCIHGGWSCLPSLAAASETCDGIDNDCDGETDETFPEQNEACEVADACAARQVCVRGQLVCEPIERRSEETCDGVDNDCDGLIDESYPEADSTCETDLPGVCQNGILSCLGGDLICENSRLADVEQCNGVDSDCDGLVDEGLRNDCGWCGEVTAEVCNGQDEDCDGVSDESASCPGGLHCAEGACREPCVSGQCGGDFVCQKGVCIPDCIRFGCARGAYCGDAGCQQAEPCAGQGCEARLCGERSCHAGEVCVQGRCELHPCNGVVCPLGSFCRDGDCVPSCAHISCAPADVCVEGECVTDSCRGVDCPQGYTCRDGHCEPNQCDDCDSEQLCIYGQCQTDPCLTSRCLPGEQCYVSMGQPQCAFRDSSTRDVSPPQAIVPSSISEMEHGALGRRDNENRRTPLANETTLADPVPDVPDDMQVPNTQSGGCALAPVHDRAHWLNRCLGLILLAAMGFRLRRWRAVWQGRVK